jgi:hypothetical protein
VATSEPHILSQSGIPLPAHIALAVTLRDRNVIQFTQCPLTLEETIALLPQRG